MSTLVVENLKGPTTGSNANKIIVPSGQELLASGHIVQVVETVSDSWTSTTSTSFASTGLSASITPSSTSSKIFIMVAFNGLYTVDAGAYIAFKLHKDTVAHTYMSTAHSQGYIGWATSMAYTRLDSPSTTSSTSYEIYWRSGTGGTVGYNNYAIGGNNTTHSTITLMEVAG